MKIKNGFLLRDVCGEKVVTPQGLDNIDFNALIALNESSAYLFERLQGSDDFSAQDMADLLCAEYEVDQATALRDSENLMKQWKEIGLAE